MSDSDSTEPTTYQLDDLRRLMARLRDPDGGCPWDLVQDYRSIAASTLEESFEVVDAIEREHFDDLQAELGDLLFQVMFYTQMAEEERRFDFNAVVDGIVRKLLRRHPHVFPDGKLYGAGNDHLSRAERETISKRWEQLKQEERQLRGHTGTLDDVPLAIPALSRAAKLQKRASAVGFDWPDVNGVLDKIEEELEELKAAIRAGDLQEAGAEFGDLLFAVVNISRHLDKDPETSLRYTNRKFENRFRFIEQRLREDGRTPAESNLKEMDALWELAKQYFG